MDEKVKALLDQKRQLTGNKYDRLTQEEKITAARAYGQLALAGQADKAKSDAYTELQKLIDGYNAKLDTKSYGKKAYQDANDYVGSARKIIDNLKSKSGAYGRYWNENEKSSFDTTLNDLSSKLDNYLAYSQQLSAFETEDEYNQAMRQSATAERYKKWEKYSVDDLQKSLDNFNVNFGSTEEEKAIYDDLKTYIAYRKSEKMDDLSMDELNEQLSGLQSSSPNFALNNDNKAQLLQSVKNTYIDRNDFKSQLRLQYESQIDYRNSDTYKLLTLDVNAAKKELDALRKEYETYAATHEEDYYYGNADKYRELSQNLSHKESSVEWFSSMSDAEFLQKYDPDGEIGLTAADKPKNLRQISEFYAKLYDFYSNQIMDGGISSGVNKKLDDYRSHIDSLERDIQLASGMQTASTYENDSMADPQFAYFAKQGMDRGDNKIVSYRSDEYDASAEGLGLSSLYKGSPDGTGNKKVNLARQFTEQQVEVYSYLLATKGKTAADAYYDALKPLLELQYRNAVNQHWKQFADDTGIIGSSIASVATSLGSGAEYIADLISGDDMNALSIGTNTIRQVNTDKIDSDLGKFVYNTVMSGADSLAVSFIPGGTTVSQAVLGLSAAASAQQDALDRGLSKGDAFLTGLVSGVFEGLFEKYSIENLQAFKKLPSHTVKNIAKNILGSVVTNASEETFTEIANIVYDLVANADLSNYEISVQNYIDQGYSEEKARSKALTDLGLQVFEAGASGALMGFGFGVGGTALGKYSQTQAGKAMVYGTNEKGKINKLKGAAKQSARNDFTSALVADALKADPSNPLAKKIQDKLGKDKNASYASIFELERQTRDKMLDMDASQVASVIEKRLLELGETGDAKTLSMAFAKRLVGQELATYEQDAMDASDNTEQISNELASGFLNVKESSAEWTKELSNLSTMRTDLSMYGNEMDADGENISAKEQEGANRSIDTSASNPKATEDASHNTADYKGDMTVEKAASEYGAQSGAYVAIFNLGQNQDIYKFDAAYRMAYDMGKSGISFDYMNKSDATQYLTKAQRENAYALGKEAAEAETKAKVKALSDQIRGKQKNEGRKKGTVKSVGVSLSELKKSFNRNQKIAYGILQTYADVTGLDIILYQSQLDENGHYSNSLMGEAQGAFIGKSQNGLQENAIYIDVNAGLSKSGDADDASRYVMLRTFAHEFVHFVEKWNPSSYESLRELILKTLEERGEDVNRLIEQQMTGTLSYDPASREVVAEALTDVLPDSTFATTLANQNPGLFKQLLTKLKSFLKSLKRYFASIAANDYSGAAALKEQVGDNIRYLQSIVDAFDKAAVEAVENYQQAAATETKADVTAKSKGTKSEADIYGEDLTPGEEGTIFNENGEPVAHATKDGTVQLSMRTYEEDGREAFRKYLTKCVKNKRLTKAEMKEMMDGIEDIYMVCKQFKDKYAPFSTWSDAAVVRDTFGKPVFSVVTPNGDYKMNLDFSLVCKKRRTLDAVFNEMAQRGIIDNFELGQKSVVKINEIIRKYGLETACALCFVDAKRFRQASMADQFTRLYNELVESLVPEDQRGRIDHFNFSGNKLVKSVADGIHTWDASALDFSHLDEVMRTYGEGTVEHKTAKYLRNHAEGRRLLLRGDFMSSAGFDAVKTNAPDVLKLYNSKKGTGGPKAAFGDVQYMNEVIKKAKNWTPGKAFAVGGVRIQSFSDYVPRMVFDYVQMIYDLAATKLPAHAYTKEALFVKQFGLTGVKINMSLIPAVAEGGIAPGLDANGDYVWAGESFDYETAKQIQNAEGYSENCGTICVGVSYAHIKKLLSDPNIRMVIPYHKSGLNPIVAHMNKIAAFTDYTNDQRTKGADGKALETEFDFNKTLHDMGENASPKAVADAYLKWCNDNGYRPKFAEFSGDENYYKMLEDFTLYDKDGKYVPQRAVKAVFPGEGAAFGSMKELIMEGLEEDAIIEGKRESSLGSIVDEIEQTLPKTEAEIDETPVAQAERDLEADIQHQERRRAVTDIEKINQFVQSGQIGELNHSEQNAISILKSRAEKLIALNKQVQSMAGLLAAQEKSNDPEMPKTKQRLEILKGQLSRDSAEFLKIKHHGSAWTAFQKIEKAYRDAQKQADKEKYQQLDAQKEETREKNKYKTRIRNLSNDLYHWITNPVNKNNNKHIPDTLKHPVIDFLKSLNMMSLQSLEGKEETKADARYKEKLDALKLVMDEIVKQYGDDYSTYLDLPPQFMNRLNEHFASVERLAQGKDSFDVNTMSAADLKTLSEIVRNLRKFIIDYNKWYNGQNYAEISKVGDDEIETMQKRASDDGRTGAVSNYLLFKNTRPAYIWERFGKPGIEIRNQLIAAQAKQDMNLKAMLDFLHGDEEAGTEGLFTDQEMQKWRKTLHTFTIGGQKVQMRTTHLMGLYLLNEQADSKRHLLGGGIRIGNFVQHNKVMLDKKITGETLTLTQSDIDMMLSELKKDDRAIEVAKGLQNYMEKHGGALANEVSMKRFGENLYNTLNYYPIFVDNNSIHRKKEEMPPNTSRYALMNSSFSKERQKGAANRIMLYDVLDVFSSHMTSVIQFNAFALSISNVNKWLDYKQTSMQALQEKPDDWEESYEKYYRYNPTDDSSYQKISESKAPQFKPGIYFDRVQGDSVRDELERVFGVPASKDASQKTGYAVSFVQNMVQDYNGTAAQGTEYDTYYLKLLGKANRVKVALNWRSAIQQPTAILRAGNVIDYRSILYAYKNTNMEKNKAEMYQHSGIAVRKKLGFRGTNVSLPIQKLVTKELTIGESVTEKGLWLAEKLDELTWATIWGACKSEVRRKQNLKQTDPGFYDAVTKLFDEVIIKTQVVDSVMTNSELMRSGNAVARTFSSFMGEPVAAASALFDAYDTFEHDRRNMGLGKAFAKNKGNICSTVYNFALTGAFASLVQSLLSDMWRDDDEYEEWDEKLLDAWWSNFLNEMDLIAKIPGVADIWEPTKEILKAAAGFDSYGVNSNTAIGEIFEKGIKLYEVLNDPDTKYTPYGKVYMALQIMSNLSGIPMATAAKEAITFWNNTAGKLYPEWKVKTYDPGTKAEIKYAYLDGRLSNAEAAVELVDRNIVKNGHEAYFLLESWEAGSGYTKGKAYYKAISKDDFAKTSEIFDHWYESLIADGELDISARRSIQSGLVSGAKELYMEGDTDAETVRSILMEYAGKSAEDVDLMLRKFDFELDHKFSYADRAKAYRRGDISESDLINAVMEVEGKTLEDARAYIRFLDLEMDHQDVDITSNMASAYFEYAEPAGISMDTYLYYCDQSSKIESDKDKDGKTVANSKKKKTLAFIDSLPLTNAQKDALYYSEEGWAESKIHEAPWH